jgi:hypothetical protein
LRVGRIGRRTLHPDFTQLFLGFRGLFRLVALRNVAERFADLLDFL